MASEPATIVVSPARAFAATTRSPAALLRVVTVGRVVPIGHVGSPGAAFEAPRGQYPSPSSAR
jgi:hypothetical protein